MNRRVLSVFLALSMVLLTVGCGGKTQEEGTEKKVVKIGASFGASGDVFDRILFEGMNTFVDENKDSVDFQMLNAQADVNMQLTNVEQLLNSGIDVLILWPYDVDALIPAVEMANEKEIPVICVNTKTNGGEYIYVGSDDVSAGKIQGEWLAEHLPENATYCYFMGPIGHSGQIGRKKGLEEILAEKRPDIKLLAEQTAMWQRDEAMDIAMDWLRAYPDVTCFASQNDNMALGIVETLRTANRMDDVIVVGTDATEEACVSIKNGEMDMSVYQNARDQGYKSVEVAFKCARGEWDGSDYEIPFEAVDSDNVDKYLELYAAMK